MVTKIRFEIYNQAQIRRYFSQCAKDDEETNGYINKEKKKGHKVILIIYL